MCAICSAKWTRLLVGAHYQIQQTKRWPIWFSQTYQPSFWMVYRAGWALFKMPRTRWEPPDDSRFCKKQRRNPQEGRPKISMGKILKTKTKIWGKAWKTRWDWSRGRWHWLARLHRRTNHWSLWWTWRRQLSCQRREAGNGEQNWPNKITDRILK